MKKTERIFEFNSIFAPFLHDYFLLKKSMGNKGVSLGTNLRLFDRYCIEKGLTELILDSELVDEWLNSFGETKPHTRAIKITQLKDFAKYFSQKGYEVNWIPKPGYARDGKKYMPYIFSEKEVVQLFDVADSLPPNYGNTRFHLLFPVILRVLYCTGARISEVLRLRISDVDLENGFLYFNGGKFDKSRRIPISDTLLTTLKRYYSSNIDYIGIDEDNFFFPNASGEQYSQRTVYDKFREILWKAGIPHQGKGKGPRVHDLRHTFAVYSLHKILISGRDTYAALTTLMAYLGHSRIGSTEYYLRLTSEIYPEILEMTADYSNRIIPKGVQIYE